MTLTKYTLFTVLVLVLNYLALRYLMEASQELIIGAMVLILVGAIGNYSFITKRLGKGKR